MTIPQGLVVPKEAFEKQQREHEEITRSLREVEEVAYRRKMDSEEETRKALEAACSAASELIASTPVSQEIALCIFGELKSLFGGESKRFAVRSSAVGEDSEELSAAGQNETFLGCGSEEQIFKALAKCWASNYAFQSVEYRR